MPIIMTTLWYPMARRMEVAKVSIEAAKKFPADETILKNIGSALLRDKRGFRVVIMNEVMEGKLQEALTWVGTRMIPFQSIKGFEYKTRLWSTVVEALEPLGMSMPG